MDECYHFLYQQLLTTLGHVTEGGPLSSGAHIGATSVPDLAADSVLDLMPLDLMVVVEPFPLTQAHVAALQTLGYQPAEAAAWSKAQRFVHRDGHQLFVYWWADHGWTEQLLVRDYLCHNEAARQRYLAAKANDGDKSADWKATLFPQLAQAARFWWVARDHFTSLHALTTDLTDLPIPWAISSGWALDLFLGEVTRYHEDVDIIVDRRHQLTLQQHMLEHGWRWLTPFGHKLEPWPSHMRIELPRHQAHAHRLRDNGENDFLDFLLTDFVDDIWRYRREPSIVQTVERAFLTTDDGVRYLAPELVLLFKSRNTGPHERAKDQLDFERVLPALDTQRRAWLRWALLVTEPEHPWLVQLT